MRVTVDRDGLVAALGTAARATRTNATLPVLAGVLVQASETAVRLTATDLDLTIQTSVAATVEDPASIVLPARYLLELTRRLPPGEVRIEVQDTAAVVQAGRSRFTLHGMPARTFPAVPSIEGEPVMLNAGALRDLLRRTRFAVLADETRPILTGVELRGDGERLRAVATDSYRIACAEKHGLGFKPIPSTVLPGRALAEVERLLRDDEESVTLFLAQSSATVEVGDVRVTTRVLEGQYPDVLGLVPQEYPHQARVNRQELVDALGRADLLAGAHTQSKHQVVLDFDAGRIVVTAQDPELGTAREEVPAGYEGQRLVIGFNARYLLDGLRVIDAEEVEIRLIDPKSPAVVQGVGEDGFRYIVLPVLIRSDVAPALGSEVGAEYGGKEVVGASSPAAEV